MANRWKGVYCFRVASFQGSSPFFVWYYFTIDLRISVQLWRCFRASFERLMSRKLMQVNFVYICIFICFLVHLGRILLPLFSPWSSKKIMMNSFKASLAVSDLVDSSSFIGVSWNCFQKLLIGLSWLSIWLVVFLEVLFGCLLNPPITVLLI